MSTGTPDAQDILLADPNETRCNEIRSLLEQHGYAIRCIASGAATMQAVRKQKPAVLILSGSLEDIPPLACLQWLQEHAEFSGIKKLLFSEQLNLQSLGRCISAGLDGILQLPCSTDRILEEITKILPPPAESYDDEEDDEEEETFFSGSFEVPDPTPVPPAPSTGESTPVATPVIKPRVRPPSTSFSGSSETIALPKDDPGDATINISDTPRPAAPTPPAAAAHPHDSPQETEGTRGNDTSADIPISVGEYDDADADDIPFASGDGDREQLPLQEPLRGLIYARLKVLGKLDHLESIRTDLLKTEGLPDAVKANLSGQNAEARALPSGKQAKKKLAAFKEKIANYKQQVDAGEAPPPTSTQKKAWELSQSQWNLLIERDNLLVPIFKATEPYLADEPLVKLLTTFKFPASRLFGLAIYQLGLEAVQANLTQQRKGLQKKLNKISERQKGLLGKLRKADDEQGNLESSQGDIVATLSWVSREINSLQTDLSEEFWKLYELAACLHVSGKIPKDKAFILRALLRFGLLGHQPWWISPAALKPIYESCCNDVIDEWDHNMDAHHVLYSDEYIRFVVNDETTGCIDEQMELTMRNTAPWTADKAKRRIIFSNTREKALREIYETIQERIKILQGEQEDYEFQKGKLLRTAKDFKQHNNELAQKIQHCKVEIGRMERALQRIEDKDLPDVHERREMAREKYVGSGVVLSDFDLARKEVAGIHRVCRLCAKLKDPFLPFVLRDYFSPEKGFVNSRQEMLDLLAHVEKCDQTIFKETLFSSRKASQRQYLRFHPVFLLTPSCGFLAYSWNPRFGVEIGRLVFPGYCPRQGLRERMLYNMLADFRWDTSKSAAGVDLLTSDTLVAAYSNVRWEYRKKKKENREKALIFNETNDRQNWRRHYELYLESAMDAGRKLFFKNYEMYEVILKYIGLPEGIERLRR